MRFEDVIYGQDFFSSAATGIVSIYLQLFDVPSNNESEEPDYSTMDAAERKKAKAIARKKKKATEKKETDSKANAEEPVSQNGNQKASEKSKLAAVDEDPLGLEFLKKDPLQEAKKYASMLVKYAPKIVNTWILQYEVAMRLKKPMLALQALFKARSLDSDSTDLFVRIIDFSSNATGSTFNDSPAAVGTVIAELTPVLLGHQSVESFILCAQDKILADPSIELPMRMAVAKAMVEKNMQKIQDAMKLITDGGIDARKVSVETCLSTQHFLESLGSDALDATVLWKDAVRKRFPMAIQPSSYINST